MMTRRRSINVFVESMIRKGKAYRISVDKTEEKGLILCVEIILNWVLRKNVYRVRNGLVWISRGISRAIMRLR
jgi:hypothetical protein